MDRKIKEKIKGRLIAQNRNLLSQEEMHQEEIRKVISRTLQDILYAEQINLSEQEKKKIVDELFDEITGFGPIEVLLKDPDITEIMINGPQKVYLERSGRRELSSVAFESEQQLMQLIYKLLAPTRRHVDESYPFTEISLKDGSRVNIIIPPLALDGPTITIRKFLKSIRSVDDLVGLGTLDKRMADFLVACIKAKINIVFSGATGAGKTTTLNVLSSYIGNDERIITIEDTAELILDQEHVVRLEARQSNLEGRGEISIRELFKNSLRMRPDRIILGEIRGAEALDMLQAICSGHKGALSVLHANTPQDVIYRLETMILTSGVPISVEVIHRQIATAINLIVQQEQFLDGSRKITHISQINGLKNNQVVLEDIFLFEVESTQAGKIKGKWRSTGVMPVFYANFKKLGIELPESIFKPA